MLTRICAAFASLTPADWALQFVRFVAVVAGILIAFALDGWNSNRLEDNRQQRLVERLAEESERGLAYLADRRDMTGDRLLGWQRLAIALGDGRCPAASDWPGLHLIDRFPSVTPPTSVLEEIVASGGLGAIDDPGLREAIAAYRARLAYLQAEARALSPTSPLIDPGDPRFALDYAPSEEEPVIARYDRRALCADGAFRDRLVLAVRDQQRLADELSLLLDDAARLCAASGRCPAP